MFTQDLAAITAKIQELGKLLYPDGVIPFATHTLQVKPDCTFEFTLAGGPIIQDAIC